MNNLTQRVLLAVPGAALLIFMTWQGGWYLQVTLALIALLVQHEMLRIVQQAGYSTQPLFIYAFGLWILFAPHQELFPPLLPGFILLLLFLSITIIRPVEQYLGQVFSTLFLGIYAPLGFSALFGIRTIGSPEEGFILTIGLFMMVWGNDVFAYFGGKNFGKHLLAPSISPKKTWEGFISGILGAAAGIGLVLWLVPFESPLSLLLLFPLVLLTSIFGPIGDLTESRLKRIAGVKDSSDILPGHGGLFDRFDALILASLACYIYLEIIQWLNYGGI